MIAMMKLDESWVARWQRLQGPKKLQPGVYAISVQGRLPHRIVLKLEKDGIKYIPRDTSERAL
jgi:transcription elongation factor SPT4